MSVPPRSKKHNEGSISWLRASTGKYAGSQHFIGIRVRHALVNGVEAMESGHYNNLTSLHTRCDEAAVLEIGRSMRYCVSLGTGAHNDHPPRYFRGKRESNNTTMLAVGDKNRVISYPSTRWNEPQETPDLHPGRYVLAK
jgi:hypothetical protein